MRSFRFADTLLISSLVAALAACAGPSGETPFAALDESETDGTGGDATSGLTHDDFDQLDAAPPAPELADNTSKLDPPSPALDACGGLQLDLDDQTDLSFAATTVGGHDDFKVFCGDSGESTAAVDVVYKLVTADDCTLSLTVTDSSELFNPAIEVRKGSCEEEVGGDMCSNRGTNIERLKFHTPANSTYWAIIDGSAAGEQGDFVFHVVCAPPTCGDGVINPGNGGTRADEECDDGNIIDGDGCSSTCMVESEPAIDKCTDLGPTDTIGIDLDQSMMLPATDPLYSNAGASVHDDYQGSCAWASGGLDQVFHVVPTSDGILTASVGFDALGVAECQPPDYDAPGCRDRTLYVREGDCEALTDLGCEQSSADDYTTVLSFPVVAGNDYYVFVDGYNDSWGSSGEYRLDLALAAAPVP